MSWGQPRRVPRKKKGSKNNSAAIPDRGMNFSQENRGNPKAYPKANSLLPGDELIPGLPEILRRTRKGLRRGVPKQDELRRTLRKLDRTREKIFSRKPKNSKYTKHWTKRVPGPRMEILGGFLKPANDGESKKQTDMLAHNTKMGSCSAQKHVPGPITPRGSPEVRAAKLKKLTQSYVKLRGIDTDIKKAKREKSQLSSALVVVHKQVRVQKDLRAAETHIRTLQLSLKEKAGQLADAESSHQHLAKRLNDRLTKLENSFRALKDEWDRVVGQLIAATKAFDNLKKTFADEVKSVRELNRTCGDYKAQLSQNKEQNAKLSEELNQRNNELDGLKQQLGTTLAQRESELACLEDISKKMSSKQHVDLDIVEKLPESLRHNISEQIKGYNTATTEANELKSQNSDFVQKRGAIEREFTQSKQANNKLSAELEAFKKKLQSQQEYIRQLSAENSQLKSELNKIRHKYQSTKKQLDKVRRNLDRQLGNVETNSCEVTNLSNENQKLKQQSKERITLIKELRERIQEKVHQIECLKADQERQAVEVEKLNQELSGLRANADSDDSFSSSFSETSSDEGDRSGEGRHIRGDLTRQVAELHLEPANLKKVSDILAAVRTGARFGQTPRAAVRQHLEGYTRDRRRNSSTRRLTTTSMQISQRLNAVPARELPQGADLVDQENSSPRTPPPLKLGRNNGQRSITRFPFSPSNCQGDR